MSAVAHEVGVVAFIDGTLLALVIANSSQVGAERSVASQRRRGMRALQLALSTLWDGNATKATRVAMMPLPCQGIELVQTLERSSLVRHWRPPLPRASPSAQACVGQVLPWYSFPLIPLPPPRSKHDFPGHSWPYERIPANCSGACASCGHCVACRRG